MNSLKSEPLRQVGSGLIFQKEAERMSGQRGMSGSAAVLCDLRDQPARGRGAGR